MNPEKFPNKKRKYDLVDRLVNFNTLINEMAESIVNTREGNNIRNQIIRSSASAALNYAEALVPESTADFIHKMNICLKELMETRVALKMVINRQLCKSANINKCDAECSELVATFISSVRTAKKNAGLKR
jgi:four helix bundle protein